MEKEVDIAAMGELLIDFTEAGMGDGGNRLFEQNPGGAPANLLTVASHMGYTTAFIGKVGKDMHGEFLKNVLEREGIGTDYLVEDAEVFTTMAFVAINEKGEREFSFARKPGADTRITVDDLDPGLLNSCRIFHFGSLSLTDEPARSATIEAVRIAKKAGALISYDPNYRESLWEKEQDAVDLMRSMVGYADVMKVSDEESLLLTGETSFIKAAEELLKMGPKLVAVTLGGDGVFLATESIEEVVGAFQTKVVDTTGAGDSFWGGFLSRFLLFHKEIGDMQREELVQCAVYGNATASLCVQKRGGIPAIPTRNEVEDLVSAW